MKKDLNNTFSKKTLQDYEVISVLGSGSFGTCYKVRDKETDKVYAWKAIDYGDLDNLKLESLVSEISVLRQLHHPNIVQYYHHLNSHEAKSIFIIMEWCEGGDLSQLVSRAHATRKRFDEKYIWRVLFQLCKALQVCHSKLKQGTVLHRDIKPANIFLDTNGNAKLGDFGLARLLRRNQTFADTVVGTPYYMSPEVIKGAPYGCRSDVWALGCLTYEMAALRPPFHGTKLQKLSNNISNGKYANVSHIYSSDLQEIIRFMLEVSDKQRPCVEMIARHPNLIRNIANMDDKFEPLVDAEQDFLISEVNITRTRLQYNSESGASSDNDSLYEDIQRLDGGFTPDLRKEIFYSANRKLYRRTFQQSDSELYKGIRLYDEKRKSIQSPNELTENIFNKFLQERLSAIRAHESLLKQKEDKLAALELKLNEKERRLYELQLKLDKRHLSLENQLRKLKPNKSTKGPFEIQSNITPSFKPESKRLSSASAGPVKRSTALDETYCSVEPQDVTSPTVAKLDLAALPPSKAFSTMRKVTFQSPKQIITYDIENMPLDSRKRTNNKLRSSCSSSESDSTTQRRKSLLSILGIKRYNKEATKENIPIEKVQQLKPQLNASEQILSQCETDKLTNIWTKENKRAAFDLLAAMNASDSSKRSTTSGLRQSMRDSARASIRRDRMRQSMKTFPFAVKTA